MNGNRLAVKNRLSPSDVGPWHPGETSGRPWHPDPGSPGLAEHPGSPLSPAVEAGGVGAYLQENEIRPCSGRFPCHVQVGELADGSPEKIPAICVPSGRAVELASEPVKLGYGIWPPWVQPAGQILGAMPARTQVWTRMDHLPIPPRRPALLPDPPKGGCPSSRKLSDGAPFFAVLSGSR